MEEMFTSKQMMQVIRYLSYSRFFCTTTANKDPGIKKVVLIADFPLSI